MLTVFIVYAVFMAIMFGATIQIKNADPMSGADQFVRMLAIKEVHDVMKIGTGLAAFIALMVYIF